MIGWFILITLLDDDFGGNVDVTPNSHYCIMLMFLIFPFSSIPSESMMENDKYLCITIM